MSNPLNGGVRSHASNPLPFPPNPARHFEDSRSTYLGELVAAAASGDVKRLASQGENIDCTLRALGAALNMAADYQLFCVNSLSEEKHMQLPFGEFSAKDGLPVVLSLLAGISEICASAVAANTDAHWVIENGGMNDEE